MPKTQKGTYLFPSKYFIISNFHLCRKKLKTVHFIDRQFFLWLILSVKPYKQVPNNSSKTKQKCLIKKSINSHKMAIMKGTLFQK